MKAKIYKKFARCIKPALAILCCAALVLCAFRLHPGALKASELNSEAASLLRPYSDTLIYDKENIDKLQSASVTDASKSSNEKEQSETTEQKNKDSKPNSYKNNGQNTNDKTGQNGTFGGQKGNNGGFDGIDDLPQKLPEIGNGGSSSEETPGGNNGNTGENTDDSEDGEFQNYFTTSIINNDVLNEEHYTFTITHLKPELQVRGIQITVNGKNQTFRGIDNSFRVNLTEGANNIHIKVVYASGSDYIDAARSYTVYRTVGDKIIIVTDLESIHEVAASRLPFNAYALKGTQRLSVSVRVNGKTLLGSRDTFTAALEYGNNTIKITAGGRNDTVQKQYTVIYRENIFKISTTISDTVITNDTNQPEYKHEEKTVKADSENYKFKVFLNAVSGKEKIRNIRFDGKVVSKGGDGYYNVKLSQRKPYYLVIYYDNSKGEHCSYRYLMRFKRNGASTPQNKYPTVFAQVEIGDTVINLENGLEFKNPDIITNITALSWDNEQLYYNNFDVSINGQKIHQACSQTGAWFGYNTYLTKEGANTITVTVTDNDGYAVTKSWRVYYKHGNVKVKVSIEASTIGLGYIIPPTEVEVPGGTSAMDIVTALLDKRGFTYNTNGGTYLSYIAKKGICRGYRIDPELMELIQKDGLDDFGAGNNPQPASQDRIGEFDFYRWSGWMFSYNGKYPGYGMNVCKPQDGAVIRIRFTLALGKDIGGFRSGQGGIYGDIPHNYYKEW